MRKEIIVAIVFGVVLGLGVATFIIFNLRRAETKNIQTLNTAGPSPVVKSNNSKIQPLEVSTPFDNALFDSKNIKIKGKASKESLIVVQSAIKEVVFKNEKEDFEIDFPLALGENKITVAAYTVDNTSTPQVKLLNVYYLDEK